MVCRSGPTSAIGVPRAESQAYAPENLRCMIASNEKTIEALQDGRITGLGYGRRTQ